MTINKNSKNTESLIENAEIKNADSHKDSENDYSKKFTKNNSSSEEFINKQDFIKVIDIDDLPYPELLRIITAIGSKNIAYYLALIVNLENRSRKLSPQLSTKILSSRSISAPASNPRAFEVQIEKTFNNTQNNVR